MNLILTFLFIIFAFIFRLIPFFVLYVFSDIIFVFLYYVFGYRKKVVYQNLTESFPDLEKKEINRLVRLSYKNLTDILVEGLKGFTMSDKQVMQRHKVINPEIIEPYRKSGRSIIATPTHYGNWEWGSLSPGLFIKDYNIVGFYKPLNNPHVDKYMKKNRGRTGTILASIYKTAETFKKQEGIPTIYIMAADQSPSNKKRAYWVNFLGRETAFLHGPERHAQNNDLPVIFVDIQRVKRGYYELGLSVIADKSSELEEAEITQRYAKKLEAVILNQPENWLWSHRRWKLRK